MDFEPEQLALYEAIVAGLADGMVLLDATDAVLAANGRARELLGGRGELPELPAAVRSLLAAGAELRDEVAVTEDQVLVVDRSPVALPGRAGSVLVLRDRLPAGGRSGTDDEFTQALRAQAHESANRMHTVVSLIEMEEYAEAVEFAVAELQLAQNLADRLIEGVADPVLAALLLGKSAQGAQRGIELVVARGTYLPTVRGRSPELVTILGNLIDNAMHVLGDGPPDAQRTVRVAGSYTPGPNGVGPVEITVSDTGPGVPADARDDMFAAGWTTKTAPGPAGARGLGLALVGQAVRRLGGCITVGDRPDGPGAVFTVRFELTQGGH